jgi:23S rRNA pseudouridine1911/1915/1917 synthase
MSEDAGGAATDGSGWGAGDVAAVGGAGWGAASSAARVVKLLVGPGEDGMRLDAFVALGPKTPSRSACVRLIESGAVQINGTLATSKREAVLLGDRVTVELPAPEEPAGLLAPNFDIPLDIRYEDEWLLVLSKQAGLVCHPAPGHVDDTLANALVAHCGPGLGLLQGEDRPGIVHRLDRDTSGLMVAAKDDATQKALQDLIRLRVLDRRYVTLVWGPVAHDEGQIVTGIARSPRDRLRMAVSDDPGAREAITTFRVLERFEAGRRDEGYTLLECHLYTGRTHQIRVHMRHVGHPVIGDPLYGRGDLARNLGLERQFLHSWHIAFEHPVTGEDVVCADTLPADLAEVLRGLESRSMGRTEAGQQICPALL